jgi:hypothetical protein
MALPRRAVRSILCAVVLGLALLPHAEAAEPADFTVDDTRDLPDKNLHDKKCRTREQTCTLRAAVQQANFLGGGRVIAVPPGTYALAIGGAFEDEAVTGDLDITADLAIQGAGARRTVIRGDTDDRLFDIHPGATVSIFGVTVEGGEVDDNGGGIRNAGELLIVRRSTISDNLAVGDGGGIHNSGQLWLFKSTVSGNTALNSGGGLANTKRLVLVNSTVGGNRVEAFGAEKGGGLRNSAAAIARLKNVTFNGNAVEGEAPEGGTMANDPGGAVLLEMAIIANSLASENCLGTMTSLGHNIDSGDSCGFTSSGDLRNADPRLGLLTNNGGPTDTHALLSSSPAIDAGTNANCPDEDQRLVARPQDGDGDATAVCDIGAYEAEPPGSPSDEPVDPSSPMQS